MKNHILQLSRRLKRIHKKIARYNHEALLIHNELNELLELHKILHPDEYTKECKAMKSNCELLPLFPLC